MYSRIMIALDLAADNEDIIDKAKFQAESNQAELFLVHVIEPNSLAAAADTSGLSTNFATLQAELRNHAKEKFPEIQERLSIPEDKCIIAEGRAASEIHRLIEELDIDLLVIGTHGQAGWQLLLGSTANSVLHGSTCDVLSVRVGK